MVKPRWSYEVRYRNVMSVTLERGDIKHRRHSVILDAAAVRAYPNCGGGALVILSE